MSADWLWLDRCGATCSDEEDSAESTTDEDNVEDNTSEDATDERCVPAYMIVTPCLTYSLLVYQKC